MGAAAKAKVAGNGGSLQLVRATTIEVKFFANSTIYTNITI